MAKSGIPDLPDSPNQPASYSFPKKSFGKKTVVDNLNDCNITYMQELNHNW